MKLLVKCEDGLYRAFDNLEEYEAWLKEYRVKYWDEAMLFVSLATVESFYTTKRKGVKS